MFKFPDKSELVFTESNNLDPDYTISTISKKNISIKEGPDYFNQFENILNLS